MPRGPSSPNIAIASEARDVETSSVIALSANFPHVKRNRGTRTKARARSARLRNVNVYYWDRGWPKRCPRHSSITNRVLAVRLDRRAGRMYVGGITVAPALSRGLLARTTAERFPADLACSQRRLKSSDDLNAEARRPLGRPAFQPACDNLPGSGGLRPAGAAIRGTCC